MHEHECVSIDAHECKHSSLKEEGVGGVGGEENLLRSEADNDFIQETLVLLSNDTLKNLHMIENQRKRRRRRMTREGGI